MLKCGFAELAITPPLGAEMPGYFGSRKATGVKDELFAKAMIANDGENVIAMVWCDLIQVTSYMVSHIRARAEKLTGICGENIMIGAIHTHTGCASDVPLYGSPADIALTDALCLKIADVVKVAFDRMVAVKVGYGETKEDTIAHIRRFYMKDGTIRTNPGVNDSDSVRSEGSIDPQVGVLRFDHAKTGKTVGLMVNYALHCDCVGGTEFSADYPGELSRQVKKNLGDDVVCMFLNGCCGNINHVDFHDPTLPFKKDGYFRQIGRVLAGKVLSAYYAIEPQDATVNTASLEISLPRRQPTAEELAWSEQMIAKEKCAVAEKITAEHLRELHERPIYTNKVVLQVVRIGDTVVCGLSGEVFVEIGKEIKCASPFAHTMVSELTNGNVGYVASNEAHANRLKLKSVAEQFSSYETRLSHYTNCAPECHDILVENAVALMRKV